MKAIIAASVLVIGAAAGHASVVLNRTDVGTIFNVDYTGYVLALPNSNLGALSSFTYTGSSSDGRSYNFNYSLTNDSTMTSRLRSFGFDVLGNTTISALSSTGTFATAMQNPLGGLLGTDICFASSTGTCGTGTGGINAGQTATGSFTLTFANIMSSIELNDFAVSYTNVGGLLTGSGMGDAVSIGPVSAAPEASTWMMMIGGFGLIGWLLRRRSAGGAVMPVMQLVPSTLR
jgi:hypothetical protein